MHCGRPLYFGKLYRSITFGVNDFHPIMKSIFKTKYCSLIHYQNMWLIKRFFGIFCFQGYFFPNTICRIIWGEIQNWWRSKQTVQGNANRENKKTSDWGETERKTRLILLTALDYLVYMSMFLCKICESIRSIKAFKPSEDAARKLFIECIVIERTIELRRIFTFYEELWCFS